MAGSSILNDCFGALQPAGQGQRQLVDVSCPIRMFEPIEAWMTTDNPYQPWHPAKYPRLKREIIGVARLPDRMRIDISEGGMQAPTLAVSFDLVQAYQGLDEGYRLLDGPDWSAARALIYFSRRSP